ncbi:hypothetical protein WAK64_17640 [Bacillus spongiae]|uniref:Uncharacterized protein n=1 Tax=Bacillus spongiae TaxID=2683610 RepID=A0ABU8HHL7_9BACI
MTYVSEGYYIISSLERPDYMDEEVIPNSIFSASECISNIHPSFWHVSLLSMYWAGTQ